MRRIVQAFIYQTYRRHLDERHNADFEVCRRPLCRLAAAAERTLYAWLYDWGM
jgi:hypothetical protein